VDAVRCAIEIQTGLAFATTRADARYCSARCRQRAHRSSITPPPDDHEQQERR
jgi:hypothetical protein